MGAADVLPCVAAVPTAIDTQYQVAALAAFIRSNRVDYLRLGSTNSQTRAAEQRGRRESFAQVFPMLAAIGCPPDAAARSLFGDRSKDDAFFLRMEDNRVAPVILI